MTADAFDVCVIGSGASGSIVAHEIARNGFRVLVLEEGRKLPPGASLASVRRGMNDALVRSPPGALTPFGRPWTVSALGGGMTLYAGIAFRYRTVDFDARAHVAADALDPVWPIDYPRWAWPGWPARTRTNRQAILPCCRRTSTAWRGD
ncbi:FAD-dependent oxidoreductase [Bradyrhizobium sp. BWA-3-5]|uniref:FAD-dependent oxidoreductase n=1 Tax=Bradyrhizobium sp. BWA-3-5 TaxID=3080013 RepID=UPI00293E92AF|nr:FAD-dependent oxidoreductase [Bradyrhizobium sp. BWA-3-5]WOH69910.1 FAD-dependent oxidoreductase [Bradyrhizobium sp. BWA-3-5]